MLQVGSPVDTGQLIRATIVAVPAVGAVEPDTIRPFLVGERVRGEVRKAVTLAPMPFESGELPDDFLAPGIVRGCLRYGEVSQMDGDVLLDSPALGPLIDEWRRPGSPGPRPRRSVPTWQRPLAHNLNWRRPLFLRGPLLDSRSDHAKQRGYSLGDATERLPTGSIAAAARPRWASLLPPPNPPT